jgi:hypothetical protein
MRTRNGFDRKPLPRWSIYIARAKAQWLGEVEAETAEEAIAKAAKEFGREASKLIAVRHPWAPKNNFAPAGINRGETASPIGGRRGRKQPRSQTAPVSPTLHPSHTTRDRGATILKNSYLCAWPRTR